MNRMFGFLVLTCLPVWAYSQEKDLRTTVLKMDSIFFSAYNSCDLETQAAIYADSIEFYHDKGGLSTSKPQILDATRRNICGKVTRELVRGSVEIYPIEGFGAIEIGLHRFFNKEEPGAPQRDNKFIIIWRNRNGVWQITRVISLH